MGRLVMVVSGAREDDDGLSSLGQEKSEGILEEQTNKRTDRLK